MPLSESARAHLRNIKLGDDARERIRKAFEKYEPRIRASMDVVARIQSAIDAVPSPVYHPELIPLLMGPVSAPPAAMKKAAPRCGNVNARMLALLAADPAALGWTARRWAARLGCAVSTVAGTTTWKQTIPAARAIELARRKANRRGV